VLPYPDAHFDAVTMLAVFEHLRKERLPLILDEVRRVLRSGGVVVLTTPAGWTEPILNTLARLGLISAVEIDEHQDTYDRAAVLGYLHAAGFTPDRVRAGSFELGMNLWFAATR
jgi:SAM-dependent methyltransferase